MTELQVIGTDREALVGKIQAAEILGVTKETLGGTLCGGCAASGRRSCVSEAVQSVTTDPIWRLTSRRILLLRRTPPMNTPGTEALFFAFFQYGKIMANFGSPPWAKSAVFSVKDRDELGA